MCTNQTCFALEMKETGKKPSKTNSLTLTGKTCNLFSFYMSALTKVRAKKVMNKASLKKAAKNKTKKYFCQSIYHNHPVVFHLLFKFGTRCCCIAFFSLLLSLFILWFFPLFILFNSINKGYFGYKRALLLSSEQHKSKFKLRIVLEGRKW